MTKNVTILVYLFPFLLCLSSISSCKKLEKLVAVSTGEVTNILTNSAEVSGEVIDIGEGVIQHGHCYGKTPDVTTSSSKSELGSLGGRAAFSSHLTNLEPGTKYYIKAYIINATETKYGKEISFSTGSLSVPILTTSTPSSITSTSAISGGSITSDGGASVNARGVCWRTTPGPTINNSKTSEGIGTGSFTSNISNLTPETTYYIRAYATNSVGTAYGNELSFKLAAISIPYLFTAEITAITTTSAASGGNITSDGGAIITARGVCFSKTQNPTISDNKTSNGTGTGFFSSSLTGLNPNTTYYVRAYATNNKGTAYGNELDFATNALSIPSLTTAEISTVTKTTATSGGNITSDGGTPVIDRGICYSTNQNPTISDTKTTNGTGTGAYASNLTGLTAGTTYFVRAYATNNIGTAYGNELSFATSLGDPLTAPTNISATPGDKEVTIKWDAGAGATGYNIYWSTSPDVSPSNYTAKISDIAALTFLQSGLTSGTTYYYVVTAKDATRESSASSIARATPPLLLQTNNMSVDGEKHYYQVTVSSGQSLFITTNINSYPHEFYLYAKYGSVPSIMDYDVKSETGDDEAINITDTQSGTYYIMVYAHNRYGTYSGSYTITASTSTMALTLGTTYDAIINYTQEKDFYEFTVTGGQNLMVNLHILNSEHAFYLYIKRGSLPTRLDYDAKSETGDDEVINIANTQVGTYYVMVYAYNRYGTYAGNYTIKGNLW